MSSCITNKQYPRYTILLQWILDLGEEAAVDGTVQKIKTILAVDNESQVIRLIESYLSQNKKGLIVKGFTDPVLALEDFQEHFAEYEAIILAIKMREMTGFQFVRRIKAIKSQVRAFLITSFEIRKSEFDKVFPSIKVEGFIQKPISIQGLDGLLDRASF